MGIGEAHEISPDFSRYGLNQHCRHRGRPLVGVHPDLRPFGHAMASHQVVPCRKREEAFPCPVFKDRGERGR